MTWHVFHLMCTSTKVGSTLGGSTLM